VSTSLIIVKTLQDFCPRSRSDERGGAFSTSVTMNGEFYLAARQENARRLPKRRISVRPLFAEKETSAPLPQVNVQLSRTNR
jgi:hypothetical protein